MSSVLKLMFIIWITIYAYNYMDNLDYSITNERYEGVCLKILNDDWEKLGKEKYFKKYPNDHKARWKCAQDNNVSRFLNWFGF